MSFFRCSPQTAKEIKCEVHSKHLYSQTYRSKAAEFHLNRANIFDVVRAIEDYVSRQHWEAEKGSLRPQNSALLVYDGNKLEVMAGTYDCSVPVKKQRKPSEGVLLERVTLAELLVLQKDFIMKIQAHGNLVINPADLVKIGEKYKL